MDPDCQGIFQLKQRNKIYTASHHAVAAEAACPSSVNEYGVSNSGSVCFTKRFRLRYCVSVFVDLRGILSASVTSLMRSAPECRITSRFSELRLQLINPSTSLNQLKITLTPYKIFHGDACFVYFNKTQYDLTGRALKAIMDSLGPESNPGGFRVLSAYLAQTFS